MVSQLFGRGASGLDWLFSLDEYPKRIKSKADESDLLAKIAVADERHRLALVGNLWANAIRSGAQVHSEQYISWGVEQLRLNPEEVRAELERVNSKVAPPAAAPSPSPTAPAPTPLSAEGLSLDKKAQRMVESFRLTGNLSTVFVPPATDSSRHWCLTFQLAPGTKFSALKAVIKEALSHGGFNPEVPAQIDPMSDMMVQIYVAKPQSQWRSINMLTWLFNENQIDPALTLDQKVYKLFTKLPAQGVASKLIVFPVGFNTRNKLVVTECVTGFKIIGGSQGGKTTTTKALIQHLMLSYRPDDVGIALIDMKSVTFHRYRGIACLVHPVIVASTFAEEYPRLVRAVSAEYARRVEELVAGGYEGWIEYGKATGRRMKPILIFFDEVALAVEQDETVLTWLKRVAATYAHAGIYLCLITQYGTTLPPVLRLQIDTAIGFKTEANAAKYTFRSAKPLDLVEELLGYGDCVVESGNLESPQRVQAFNAPPDHRDAVLKQYKLFYPQAPEYLPVPEESDGEEDVWGEAGTCPSCGSNDVAPHGTAGRKKCKSCSKTWSERK